MDRDRRKGASSDRALPTRAQRGLAGVQAPIVGRLQRHGAAPYQFRRNEEISYYVDLIVLGSRERHGLALLLNFTGDAVLHAAPCDVLAVRLH